MTTMTTAATAGNNRRSTCFYERTMLIAHALSLSLCLDWFVALFTLSGGLLFSSLLLLLFCRRLKTDVDASKQSASVWRRGGTEIVTEKLIYSGYRLHV